MKGVAAKPRRERPMHQAPRRPGQGGGKRRAAVAPTYIHRGVTADEAASQGPRLPTVHRMPARQTLRCAGWSCQFGGPLARGAGRGRWAARELRTPDAAIQRGREVPYLPPGLQRLRTSASYVPARRFALYAREICGSLLHRGGYPRPRLATKTEVASILTACATRYFEGDGVGKDVCLALRYLGKADATSESEAAFILGAMYFEGLGVEKDEEDRLSIPLAARAGRIWHSASEACTLSIAVSQKGVPFFNVEESDGHERGPPGDSSRRPTSPSHKFCHGDLMWTAPRLRGRRIHRRPWGRCHWQYRGGEVEVRVEAHLVSGQTGSAERLDAAPESTARPGVCRDLWPHS